MGFFVGLSTEVAHALRRGEVRPYGRSAERWISPSDDAPSRHCLSRINRGREMLICAHHPFSALQPDAETGPIFLCADACQSATI